MYIKRIKIRQVIKELRNGELLNSAIEKAGISNFIYYHWRDKPARFSKYWNIRLQKITKAAQESCDDKRVRAVEDTLYKKLISGEAAPALYIFYLCNRGLDRWKNDYRVEHSGKISGGMEKLVISIVNNNNKEGQLNNASGSRIASNSSI
ncbi:MAG: hypothetical protein BWY21_01654 [Parcubacteria group bacterium ADurb.Bin216]|nr:MAG: hypothetical protein BWY21_01654 [Parcubacteria group bacterium ADurb.Bin216]